MVSHGAPKWFDTGEVEVAQIPGGQCDTSVCARFILESELGVTDPSPGLKAGISATLKVACIPNPGCHMADPSVDAYVEKLKEARNA